MLVSQHFFRRFQRHFFQSTQAWILALSLVSATSASDVLRYMPEDALGFALVSHLKDVDAKVGRLTQLFGLTLPSPLAFAKLATGLEKGLRLEGDLLVALLPGPNETREPLPMVLLPVENYATFATSIHGDASGEICRVVIAGEEVLIAKRGSYVLLMNVEHRETLELMLGLQPKPVATLQPLEPWLAKNDVAIALMPNGIKMLLELGRQALVEQRKQFAEMSDKPQYSAMVKQLERNAEISRWVLDLFGKEIKMVAFGIALDENTNLRIGKRVVLRKGSPWMVAKTVLANRDSPLKGFAEKPFVLAGGGPLPESWGEALATMSCKFMERMPELYGLEDLDREQWQQLEDSYRSMITGLRSSSVLMLPGKEGEPLFGNIFGIAKTVDSANYFENYIKVAKLWNEFMATSTSDIALVYEVIPKTIAGAEACEIVVDVAAAAQDPNVPAFNWVLEAMFGEDGKMRQLLVAADKQTLVYGMTAEEQLLPIIEDVKQGESGLRKSADIQRTLKLMPDTPWKLFVSPQGGVQWAKRIVEEFLVHLMGQTPNIPDFDACPPLGMTFNLVDAQIEADLVCPVETLKALAAYIEKCKAQ